MYKIKKTDIIETTTFLLIILVFFIYFGYFFYYFQNKTLQKSFPKFNTGSIPSFLKPIYSESLVVLEERTGHVVFAKNPHILFPPASLTKMVTLYMIYEKIHEGIITKDTIVPIPLSAWAKMLPSDASLMFLEPGQTVTMYELMLGLAIPSGNDAAIAVAEFLSGSVKQFVKEMNKTVRKLGLHHIHFEDANGYSANNYITAYEFALFCREYIRRFPESIEELHTVDVLRFPTKKNYPNHSFRKRQTISQKNHNPLLGHLEGTEGLKTGYIGKSGFNVAVSVKRGETRLIAVDLGSFAGTAKIANHNRVEDITKVINYIYDNYHLYSIPQLYSIPTLGLTVSPLMGTPEIYHYAKLTSIKPIFYTLPKSIVQGQIIGKLALKDALGQDSYYPLTAQSSIPAKSSLELLWGWLFKIWSAFIIK